MVESVTTLLSPSAAQKRLLPNGRSSEITSTTALLRPPAFSLNFRVEVPPTDTSRLGTMFSTLRLPAKSRSATSFRSLPTRLNSGAVWPALGNEPATSIGVPLNVTVAIPVSLFDGCREARRWRAPTWRLPLFWDCLDDQNTRKPGRRRPTSFDLTGS